MWIPIKLVIENFRSFNGSHEFLFRKGETYLVQGVNNSDSGVKSNGSGKTSLPEAMRYTLGLPVYAATLTDLINDGCDFVCTEFHLRNDLLNQTLVIKRGTPAKGSSIISVFINDVDQKDNFSTVPEGDKFIIKTLGISKEDLLNYYLIGREKFVSFFSSSDNDKKELINRFSKATKVDGVYPLISKDIDTKNEAKATLTTSRDKIQGKIDTYEEEIEELENPTDEDEVEGIEELEEKIAFYSKEIKSIDKSKEISNNEIEKKEKSIAKIETEITAIDNKLEKKSSKTLKEELKTLESELKDSNSLLTQVETMLAGTVTCPKCDHEFTPGEEVSVEESTSIKEELEGIIVKQEKKVEDKEAEIDTFEKEIKLLKKDKEEKEDSINALTREIRSLKQEIRSSDTLILSKNKLIDSVKEEIKAFKESDTQARKQELLEKIETLKVDIEKENKRISDIDVEIYNLNQWVFRFNKFKSHLANKSLSTIQGYSNLYLQKMHSNLGLRIEGFKQNKDGSIREKITPIVLRDGMVEGSGSYKRYSGGERCKIDLAPTLACRNLINLSSPSGGLDLLLTDEITEGLDSVGIENYAASVAELGITSLIISHTQHEKNFPNVITVEKNNFMSSFIYNN